MSPSRVGENTISDPIQNCIEEDILEIIVLASNARINTSNKVVQALVELEGHPWDVILSSETRASESHNSTPTPIDFDRGRPIGVELWATIAVFFHVLSFSG